jgi:integrase/recombinase XerD
VIDTYLTYLRDVRRVAANTVESYARDLAALASFAERRGRAPEALDRRDLEGFVRGLMSDGLSPRSVARAVACVRGFYRFVTVEQKREVNPADDLRAPRAWPALPRFLDLEEVDRLLAQPDVSTPRGLRDKALIELLYATGLRVSELVALKPGNLNLDEGYLSCVGKGTRNGSCQSARRRWSGCAATWPPGDPRCSCAGGRRRGSSSTPVTAVPSLGSGSGRY